jgi:ABC-2 type transport system ATP-binding protein
MNQQNGNGLAVESKGLIKRYDGEVVAIDGIDLAIEKNTIFALLGPNGAGKTTTISILTTLIEPTGGWATVDGLDVVRQADEVRRRIGVTFQEIVLDPDQSGREALDFHGRLYKMDKARRGANIEKLLKLVELDEAADRRTNTYSGGMKRRLELARGLMTDPDVLFLDEPTQGLDPQNRAKIWEYIRNLKEESGMTLLLTTHYMEEAEALADRVGIIDHGKVVAEGSPHELTRKMGSDVLRIQGRGEFTTFCREVEALPYVESCSAANGLLQIGVDSGNKRLADVVTVANSNGF